MVDLVSKNARSPVKKNFRFNVGKNGEPRISRYLAETISYRPGLMFVVYVPFFRISTNGYWGLFWAETK